MEIVKSNFVDNLSEILKDLEEAAFVSFDGEFTGLANERNILPFDTSEEYYLKRLKASSGFILVQLGLSFIKVRKNEDGTDKVTCKSYNIFVYPQSKNATFLSQGQSLSFLAGNGFDFNKLFCNGISFCNAAEEEKLREEMKVKQQVRMEQLKQKTSTEEVDTSTKNFIPVPENELELIGKVHSKLQEIVDGKVAQTSFDKLNNFQRKLIYELIEREFNNKISTSVKTAENNRKVMIVEPKRSAEEEMAIELNRQKQDEADIAEAVGLRLLLKEISASKKLIVGHNCLMDLMYLINQCFEDLPPNYEDFKKLVHKTFPNIVDTKFFATSEKFKEMFNSSVLSQVFDRLKEEPFNKVDVEFENPYCTYSFDFPKEHEAGYDSYLTGYCLLQMLNYLKVQLSDSFEPTKCKELNPFLNRIALMRIAHPYIFVTGKEPKFSRDHVFSITFPPTWQTSDIQDRFKNYGPIQIAWTSDKTAWVSLYNKENASCVLKTIDKAPGFEIQSFAEHQAVETLKRDISLKRKKEESESSESSSPVSNGVKASPASKKKKNKKLAKKAFAEGDIW